MLNTQSTSRVPIAERAAGGSPDLAVLVPTESSSTTVREDLVERVLKALLADADRAEGNLQRVDIDRAYLRRNLTIPECEWVEARLRQSAVQIVEADDDEESEDEFDSVVPGYSPASHAFLTELEERELGRKIQLARRMRHSAETVSEDFAARVLVDAERARTKFVQTNIRYLHKLTKQRRFLRHLSHDDLFQEGVLGLLHATELWDPELGFRFKTYATWWIQQRMHRAVDDTERTIRLPVYIQETVRKIRRKRAALAIELKREPTLGELADYIGSDKERIAKLLWRVQATDCLEADAPISEEGESIVSFKADDETPSPFDLMAQQELRAKVSAVLASLPPREERVLRMRFGLEGNEEKTLEAIGQLFGVTRERIRQIEEKALRRLMHPSRSRIMRSFLD